MAEKPLRPGVIGQPDPFAARVLTPRWTGRVGESRPDSSGAAGRPANTESAHSAGRPAEHPLDNPGLAGSRARDRMVERLREQGIRHERVLSAMQKIPRHSFVDAGLASRAYEDTALPIGHAQTISQPYVVARSMDLALTYFQGGDRPRRALEVGTGCGYQAAVMARVFSWVASIERIEALHRQARRNLAPLALASLHLILGDGLEGLPEHGPYDVIVLAAGMADIPGGLLRQLAPGGVLIAPLGAPTQHLELIRRPLDLERFDLRQFERLRFDRVQFVPILQGVQRLGSASPPPGSAPAGPTGSPPNPHLSR